MIKYRVRWKRRCFDDRSGVNSDGAKVFICAFPLPVVVVEVAVPSTEFLDVVVVRPPIDLSQIRRRIIFK